MHQKYFEDRDTSVRRSQANKITLEATVLYLPSWLHRLSGPGSGNEKAVKAAKTDRTKDSLMTVRTHFHEYSNVDDGEGSAHPSENGLQV